MFIRLFILLSILKKDVRMALSLIGPGVPMPKPSPVRKEKKTFSLSRQAVMYLEAIRKEQRSRSVSAVLEEIIRQQQQARIGREISQILKMCVRF